MQLPEEVKEPIIHVPPNEVSPTLQSLHSQRRQVSTVPIEAVLHTALPGVIIWLLTVTGGSLITRKGFDINVDILREDSKE